MERKNNGKLEKILSERKLAVTRYIRHIYLLKNGNNEFLVVNKECQPDVEDIYLGWQLHSECSFGCDLFDEDILNAARDSLSQSISPDMSQDQIQLVEVFSSHHQGIQVLHLVYYLEFDDISSVNFWSDYDIGYKWLKKKTAMGIIEHKEDKNLLNTLKKG